MILVSPWWIPADAQRAEDDGALGYLVRPISLRDIARLWKMRGSKAQGLPARTERRPLAKVWLLDPAERGRTLLSWDLYDISTTRRVHRDARAAPGRERAPPRDHLRQGVGARRRRRSCGSRSPPGCTSAAWASSSPTSTRPRAGARGLRPPVGRRRGLRRGLPSARCALAAKLACALALLAPFAPLPARSVPTTTPAEGDGARRLAHGRRRLEPRRRLSRALLGAHARRGHRGRHGRRQGRRARDLRQPPPGLRSRCRCTSSARACTTRCAPTSRTSCCCSPGATRSGRRDFSPHAFAANLDVMIDRVFTAKSDVKLLIATLPPAKFGKNQGAKRAVNELLRRTVRERAAARPGGLPRRRVRGDRSAARDGGRRTPERRRLRAHRRVVRRRSCCRSSASSGSSEARVSPWLAVAAALGAGGVVLGAFGAHALRARLAPELLAAWQTGVLYHLLHSVALLALALFARRRAVPSRSPRRSSPRASCSSRARSTCSPASASAGRARSPRSAASA